MDDALFELPDSAYRFRRCPVCGGALSVTYAATYFVQRQGWVKIGATNNPRRRLSELGRPAWTQHLLSPAGMDWTEPLVVLAVLEGDVEHELHRRFRDAHALGEWFLPDLALRKFLEGLDLRPARGGW